jgi:hypothetical protein
MTSSLISKKAVILWALLCVYLPGLILAFLLPWNDVKWSWVFLAGVAILGGAVSVGIYNWKSPRGALSSLSVACRSQIMRAYRS